MVYELIRLALGNLLRARARLAMTSGGVVVGTTAVLLLIGITVGLQTQAEAGIGSSTELTTIYVYPGFPQGPGDSAVDLPQLTIDAVRSFWQIPGVALVIPTVSLQAYEMRAGDLTGNFRIVGIDPALIPYMGFSVQQGVLSLERGEVLVGPQAGAYFFDPDAQTEGEWQPTPVNPYETPVEVVMYQNGAGGTTPRRLDLNVVGVLSAGNPMYDSTAFMPIEDVLAYNAWITGQEFDPQTFRYEEVIVRATSRETVQAVMEAIKDLGYGAGGMADYLNSLNQYFSTMRVMLGGIGGVALLVAAFGVANTMMMAILERTKEIGLMKAIGATDRDVLTIFLVEAGLVGMAGGLAGAGLSLTLQNVINEAVKSLPQDGGGISFLPIDPAALANGLVLIPPELTIFGVALATAVGVGAGLYPALRAAQLTPVLALKQE